MRVLEQFSYSSVEKYLKCSYLWWLYYDKVVPRPITDTVPTVAGTITHRVLDCYYEPTGVNRAIPARDLLDLDWQVTLGEMGVPHLYGELQSLAEGIIQLHARAAKGYKGRDAIVDPDTGKPYSQPTRTNAWKQALAELKLDKTQREVDRTAKLCGGVWDAVSLSSVFSETYVFLGEYQDTLAPLNLTVQALELPISGDGPLGRRTINPVRFPNNNEFFVAKIDLIATDPEGRIYLLDHKTSKKLPSMTDAQHWEQLLIYAWAHFMLWGVWPQYIGINSLRDNKLITAPFKPELVEGALARHTQALKGIEAEIFIQQSPTSFGSNCYNDYSKEKCAYLNTCHPDFFRAVRGR